MYANMTLRDFASTIDSVFDRFEVVGCPLSDWERPLDELFGDLTAVIHWSAVFGKRYRTSLQY